MCYIAHPAGDRGIAARERSAQDWIQLAQDACEAGMLYLLFTGGEVFLRADFQEIYMAISRLGTIPTIYTNATLITPAIVRWLREAPPEKIEVTIYGASAATYQAVCGAASAFELAVQGVDALLDAGFELRLKTTVIPDNERDYEGLMEFAAARGIVLQFCTYISPRRGKQQVVQAPAHCRLSPGDLARYLHRANADYRRIHCSSEDQEGKRNQAALDDVSECSVKTAFACSAGKRDFWISWDGGMVPCGLMEQPRTMPFETGFLTAWRQLRKAMEAVPKASTCQSCSLRQTCITCPARLWNETGTYDRPALYLCDLANVQKLLYDFIDEEH
jgi:radical SAM protein with 4Fe4S-binding SPASM domain